MGQECSTLKGGVHKQVLALKTVDMPLLCGTNCTQLQDLQNAWGGHHHAMTSFACAAA
jgi:hypothetical protein